MNRVLFTITFTAISVASAILMPSSPCATPTASWTPEPMSLWGPSPEPMSEIVQATSQARILCIDCATRACPPGCPQNTCVLRWHPCSPYSRRCCNNWRCVVSRRAGFRRCEPPAPRCTPKWWHCGSSRPRCCHGWRCVRPARSRGFKGLRCEPPPKKCIPNWWHCKGLKTRCCGGWRCIRSRNPKFRGLRCEP